MCVGVAARNWLLIPLYGLLVASAAASQREDPSLYFASTENDAYLDWLKSNKGSYSNSVFLPSPNTPEYGAAIHWSLDDDNIYLALATRATGWAGFGIAEAGGMKGADIVLYTAETNTLTDAHVLDNINAGPIEDECQSWILQKSQTIGGFLIFEAVRPLDTRDPQDRPIINDASAFIPASRVIAAWGDTATVSYHGPASRVKSSIRFHGNSDAAVDEEFFQTKMENEAEGFVDILAQDYPIKPIQTDYAYFCFSFSDLLEQGVPVNEELHIIGIEPMIDTDGAPYVHHFIVSSDEQDIEQSGKDCSSQWGKALYVWASGDGLFAVPDEVGLPFGKNGDMSFQLQIHYDNLALDSGVLDNSGCRMYYTTKKRQFDLAFFWFGDPSNFLEGQTVGKENTFPQHTFDCPSSCSTLLGQLGISKLTVLWEGLHMHESGARMNNRQIRDGNVVRESSVEVWDFNQQGVYAVQQNPFVILPGDSFKTSCHYRIGDTPKQFGLSSLAEMCLVGLYYYPRLPTFVPGYGAGCIYDAPVPQCNASWEANGVESSTELEGSRTDLERNFGSPAISCSLENNAETSGGYFFDSPFTAYFLVVCALFSFIGGF